MFSPKMQANAPMKNRMPVPPVMLRPMYAPSAVHPTVSATSPITCPNTACERSRVSSPAPTLTFPTSSYVGIYR